MWLKPLDLGDRSLKTKKAFTLEEARRNSPVKIILSHMFLRHNESVVPIPSPSLAMQHAELGNTQKNMNK